MLKWLALTFLIFAACSSPKLRDIPVRQLSIRNEVRDTLLSFIQDSTFASKAVGDAALQTLPYFREMWISKNATSDELKQMIQSDNSFAKGLGIKLLVRRRDMASFEYAKVLLNDTLDYIYIIDGCLGEGRSLAEFTIYQMHRRNMMPGNLSFEQVGELNRVIERNHLRNSPLEYNRSVLPTN